MMNTLKRNSFNTYSEAEAARSEFPWCYCGKELGKIQQRNGEYFVECPGHPAHEGLQRRRRTT